MFDVPPDRRVLVLLIVSALLAGVRLYASTVVGFGDSEALYASWALHPQAAYLDHPGLIGLVARWIGDGAAPGPQQAHLMTSVLSTFVPWLLFLVAQRAGASRVAAAGAAIAFALTPEISVGLFALTPDLLLAITWLAALGLFIIGLGSHRRVEEPGEGSRGVKTPPRAKRKGLKRAPPPREPSPDQPTWPLLGAGLLAGVSATAKVSGLLLMASFAAVLVSLARDKDAPRARARRYGWIGIVAGLVVQAPIVMHEVERGFPMLRHRLIDTQRGARPFHVLGNLGALVGGQLVYLSPVFVVLALLLARDLTRRRNEDTTSRVLFWSFAIPIAPLVLLCILSPVAEPHWIAPPLLALPIHAARRADLLTARWKKASVVGAVIALTLTVAAHAWVLVGASARLMPEREESRFDIANELYGWPQAAEAARELMQQAATPLDSTGREVVVVGPHWTICAQLHVALPGVRVGCATPIRDDFDDWLPRDSWRNAAHVLFVTDNRFETDGAAELPLHARLSQSRVRTLRGGRPARVFTLYLYSRMSSAELTPTGTRELYSESDPRVGDIGWSPASRMSAMSSSWVGFGVVSRRSP